MRVGWEKNGPIVAVVLNPALEDKVSQQVRLPCFVASEEQLMHI